MSNPQQPPNNPQQPPNNPNQAHSTIDLGELAKLDLGELTEHMDLSLKSSKNKNNFDYLLEFFPLLITGTIVIFSVYSCFQILNSKTASPDEKKYAQSTITLIAGGAMGYFAGKTNNKN
jgi:hypothetical protein